MKYYAVIDTNVLVSALLSKSDTAAAVEIYKKIMTGDLVPLYSQAILREYDEVLHRPRFGFADNLVSDLLYAIFNRGILIDVSTEGIILNDMGDVPFYAVVMAERDKDAYLVTGNIKHFPKETFIVTPREMLDIMTGCNLSPITHLVCDPGKKYNR